MAFPQTVRWINEIKTRLVEMSGFLVPSGVILMWSGTTDNIPKGWFLCDGTNGTPNLRDRFIIGAGGKYSPGATGGAASVTPEVTAGTAKTGISLANASPSGTAGSAKTGISIQIASISVTTGSAKAGVTVQNTTLTTNTMPSHPHSVWGVTNTTRQGYCQNVHTGLVGRYQEDVRERGWVSTGNDGQYLVGANGSSQGHGHGVSDPGHTHSASGGQHGHGVTDPGHTHTVTTAAHGHVLTDSGHSHTITTKAISVMNPYYALCLIQKQ